MQPNSQPLDNHQRRPLHPGRHHNPQRHHRLLYPNPQLHRLQHRLHPRLRQPLRQPRQRRLRRLLQRDRLARRKGAGAERRHAGQGAPRPTVLYPELCGGRGVYECERGCFDVCGFLHE